MDNRLLLILVVLPVILAGCIGQPPTTKVGAGQGVVITSFSPELQQVDSEDSVLFTITVKNLGDISVAKDNAKVDIFGLDDWTGTKSLTVDSELRRADPTRGEEGGEVLKDTTLKAPLKDVTVTYDPTARVSYDYKTKSTVQMKLVTKELIRSDPSQKSTSTVTTTGGPFVVSVRGALPTISSGGTTETPIVVTFQLEIQNIGGGRAFSGNNLVVDSTPDPEIDEVDISVSTVTGVTAPVCTPSGSGQRLIGGKSRILSCTQSFTGVPAAGFATTTFDLVLDYYYFVDTQSTVTVLKPLAGTTK